jgi:hypothetical protein
MSKLQRYIFECGCLPPELYPKRLHIRNLLSWQGSLDFEPSKFLEQDACEEKLTSPHHEFIDVLMGPNTINSKDNERNTEEAAKNDPNSLQND